MPKGENWKKWKGKTWEERFGKEKAKEMRIKISNSAKFHMLTNHPSLLPGVRKKMSENRKGK